MVSVQQENLVPCQSNKGFVGVRKCHLCADLVSTKSFSMEYERWDPLPDVRCVTLVFISIYQVSTRTLSYVVAVGFLHQLLLVGAVFVEETTKSGNI